MKAFNDEKFFVIVDEGGATPTFVTFGSSGGFRKCETLVEASKFKDINKAINSTEKDKNLKVYSVEVTEKCGLDSPDGSTHWETWTWKEVKE